MRYSQTGQHIVMERGQHPSDGVRRIEVCEAATGAVVATFPAGFNPRWLTHVEIVAESPFGASHEESEGALTVHYIPANRGQLDANGAGVWAVSDLSQATVTPTGPPAYVFPNAREPRIAQHPVRSYVAVRHPATGSLRFTHRAPEELGPCEDSRWSSETLVWWLGGRVWGRTTPDQPTVELTVPGRACSHPVPLWTGSRLFVGLVLDDGELWVCEWGNRERGWRVGASDGAGFDWHMKAASEHPETHVLDVCYFNPHGRPVFTVVDTTVPPESMLKPEPPPPDPERWTLVPDGTLVTGAIETLIGANPVRQGDIICLHKNTFPECEWREVHTNVSGAGKTLYHWADASRFPGDRGWWIEPAPIWCLDEFVSGITEAHSGVCTLVDFHNGTTNRWQQTNTLYGLKDGGGVMIRFDPRFPNQYTDMAKRHTPEWAPAGYEKQWTRNDGWARWEYWVTPLYAKGSVAWGDPTLDILIDYAESGPGVPSAPLPFVPCPRPLTTQPPQEPDVTTPDAARTRADDIQRAAYPAPSDIVEGAMNVFRANLLERDVDPEGMSFGALRYFMQFYFPAMAARQVRDGIPGSAAGWGDYSWQAVQAAMAVYNRDQKPQEPGQPPVTGGTLRGPIGVEGRDFTTP